MDEYALFLGCVIPTRLPHVERSVREIFRLLDIKVTEMPGAGCCPDPIASQSLNVELWTTLAARNMIIAEDMHKDIITVCAGCYETLKTASTLLAEDDGLKSRVNAKLAETGLEYQGTSRIYHFVEILSQENYLEKLKSLTQKPLNKIMISSHNGCHLLRPSEILGFDNPERPERMDKILSALGADISDTPKKNDCCGYCVKLDQSIGRKLVEEKVEDLQENDVDGMSVVCPSCFLQFDRKQKQINKDNKVLEGEHEKLETPVLYLSELIAVALGVPLDHLNLRKRAIKPKKLLSKIKIS